MAPPYEQDLPSRMPAIRDVEYAAVVERERPLIQATAYLLTGDAAEAERVVQLVFAELYERWRGMPDPRLKAIRAVVHTARAPVHLPWENRDRFELIDGPRYVPAAEPIVVDLQMLTYDKRVAIVLELYAELPSTQIAEILQLPVGDVLSHAEHARASLAARRRERARDEVLVLELEDAIPYHLREPYGDGYDLAHGRSLIRRRWIQRGSAVLVGVVLVVAAVLLVPTRPPVPQAAPPLPIPTTSRQNCDPTIRSCRARTLFKWRSEMAEVAASYVDPGGDYFSGFGIHGDSRSETPGFWSGGGGALAFEMFRLDKGATAVYIQIATSRKSAVRCGATTHQKCLGFRSMDGNSYLLTDSSLADGGIEVQYSPEGDEVITIIARNTQRGRVLEISSGDLIKLVQDDRLRLPNRCCYRR
jgi:DNA-directed RNA polymerase specialized sigma24 family protein